MRPYDGYSDDFEDFEGFEFDKTRSLQRLVNEARREERQRNRSRSSAKRRHQDDWNWDDDDDWDSYLDDSSADGYEDLNGHY